MANRKDETPPKQAQKAIDNLRQHAEEVLRGNPLEMDGLSTADIGFIIHELQVHQLELQLQNEELRRLQQELAISRDNFSDLYDFAPVPYCTLDQKGRIQETNRMCSKMFGVDNKTLIGQYLANFVHPDDQDSFYLHYRRTLKNKERQIDEIRMLGMGGVTRYVQIQSLLNSHPKFQVQVILFDITERKSIMQALQEIQKNLAHRLRELNALHEATSSLQSTLDTDKLLPRILQSILKAIPSAKFGLIYLASEDVELLHVSASAFSPDATEETFLFSGRRRYVKKVLTTKQPLLLPEIKISSREPSVNQPNAQKIRSALIVPLITREQVYGAISLESPEKGAFSPAELDLLESFAATAAAALRNARLHEQLQKLTVTDFLTGVYNRQGFDQIGALEFQQFLRYAHPLTLLEMDVDGFKLVNDTYGHAAGDQVLIEIGKRVQSHLRKSDILCRYGGDEFVILLPDTNLARAVKIAKRLSLAIQEPPMQIEGKDLQVAICQGICQASKEMNDLSQLFQKADSALYLAKAAGRNEIRAAKHG